jgi:hypothetical protein
MENWTGIIKGTNRGLLHLQLEYSDQTKFSGKFSLIDADAINLSAKVEGCRENNSIKATLSDFDPKIEGVPKQGSVDLVISEDETKMEGSWQTDLNTKGECTLYKFSINKQELPIQEPSITLETKDILINYYTFDR